jgi:hypothetical protein
LHRLLLLKKVFDALVPGGVIATAEFVSISQACTILAS